MSVDYRFGAVLNADEIREILINEGFTQRLTEEQDLRRSQFHVVHPTYPTISLVCFIDVPNVFKQDEYRAVHIFTLVKGHPLNVTGHPLNIAIGLEQVHDAALFTNIIRGILPRFRGLDADASVLDRYRFTAA